MPRVGGHTQPQGTMHGNQRGSTLYMGATTRRESCSKQRRLKLRLHNIDLSPSPYWPGTVVILYLETSRRVFVVPTAPQWAPLLRTGCPHDTQ